MANLTFFLKLSDDHFQKISTEIAGNLFLGHRFGSSQAYHEDRTFSIPVFATINAHHPSHPIFANGQKVGRQSLCGP
ncbi:hypothetical protein A6D6_03429 [Alcanivorax xiamenensis]|uniref:Uncharacterized protein n=1 Tax=Alcanivorax xiamenensis TaxID=1177156 RepID=A0ABQ6Y4S9_9GAMM|nr:hypothetical protein A6D6_03429 [Alcanivorax xiamenensis]